jgi:hypothetical protein
MNPSPIPLPLRLAIELIVAAIVLYILSWFV